jgi:hypothetical protein
MSRDAYRQFVAGHRAAEARALKVIRDEGPRPADESFARAMELLDLIDEDAVDPLRENDDAQARASWAKVRAWAAKQDHQR